MSTVQTTQYHSICPSCGAAHDGSGVCAYCGASMVASQQVTQVNETPEQTMMREDAGLPLVKGKSGQISGFMKVFCILFGGIFLFVPTFLILCFAAVGLFDPLFLASFAVFPIVGIGALTPVVRASAIKKRCMAGRRLNAVVRYYVDGDYLVNDKPVQILRLRTEEPQPRIIELNMGESKQSYAPGMRLTLANDEDYFVIL